MRVVVDYDLCESNALCMAAAPEVFEVRDDDFLYVLQEEPAEDLRGEGRGGRPPLPQASHHDRGLTARRWALDNIVIVGASLAGLRAAEELRNLGHDGGRHHRRRRAAPALRPAAAVEAGPGRRQAARVAPRSAVSRGTLDDLELDWRLGESATGLDLAERVGAARRRRAAAATTAW